MLFRSLVGKLPKTSALIAATKPSTPTHAAISSFAALSNRFPMPTRHYSAGRPEKSEFEKRALEVLRGFDKVDASKLSLDAHFTRDLGLDSLDCVEVVMAIEDEFMVEIPDADADNMSSLRQAVEFCYERWTPEHFR